jgi:hypothetical protein
MFEIGDFVAVLSGKAEIIPKTSSVKAVFDELERSSSRRGKYLKYARRAAVAIACGGVVCGAAVVAYKIHRRWGVDYAAVRAKVSSIIYSGLDYVPDDGYGEFPDSHDAPSPAANVVVGGDAPNGDVSTPQPGPAARRIREKQEVVHVPYSGGTITSPYIGSVVCAARCEFASRDASALNQQLARSYMVRLMRKHGVREAHINVHIDRMVLAVFFVTEQQREVLRDAELLRRNGDISTGGSTF